MTKTTKLLIGLYVLSAVVVFALFSKNTSSSASISSELATTKSMLAVEQATGASLDKKLSDARASAEFLSLALCPTLETNRDALCVKSSNEWLSQTIQTGTSLSDTETKTKIAMLLSSLSSKKQPTAKEFYELLKPIEVSSLKFLSESLR